MTRVTYEIGPRVPDLSFEVAPGEARGMSELVSGACLLIFLRHLA